MPASICRCTMSETNACESSLLCTGCCAPQKIQLCMRLRNTLGTRCAKPCFLGTPCAESAKSSGEFFCCNFFYGISVRCQKFANLPQQKLRPLCNASAKNSGESFCLCISVQAFKIHGMHGAACACGLERLSSTKLCRPSARCSE